MGIFDIDNTQRTIATGVLKRACGNPSPVFWAKIRRTVGVPYNKRFLTARESFLLWVGCQLRNKPNLSRTDIYAAAAAALEKKPDLSWKTPKMFGSEGVLGLGLIDAIGLETGYYPSEATLRNWGNDRTLPKFSRKTQYNGQQITKYCNKARSLRINTVLPGKAPI